MKPKEMIRVLENDGWYEVDTKGRHCHFKHPTKPGKITVPVHNQDMTPKILHSILKQAGLR